MQVSYGGCSVFWVMRTAQIIVLCCLWLSLVSPVWAGAAQASRWAETQPGDEKIPVPQDCKVAPTAAERTQLWRRVNGFCRGRGAAFGYVMCIHEGAERVQGRTPSAVRRRPGTPESGGLRELYEGMPLCVGDQVVTWKDVRVWVQEVARAENAAGEVGQTWQVESFTELRLSWAQSVVAQGQVNLHADPLFKSRRIALGERGSGWWERPPTAGTSNSDVRLEVLDGCRGEAVVSVAKGAAGEEHWLKVERPLGWLPVRVWTTVRGGTTKQFESGGKRVREAKGEAAQGLEAETRAAAEGLAEKRASAASTTQQTPRYFEAPSAVVVGVEVQPGDAVVKLEGERVWLRRGRGEVRLLPGLYTVEVEAEGYTGLKTEVEVKAGGAQVLALRLERAVAMRSALGGEPERSQNTALPGSGEVPTWISIPGTGPDGFMMGSKEGEGEDDELPRHKVVVQPFQLSKTEVTVAQYQACVDAGKCTEPGTGNWCNWKVKGREQHPINCVDWSQAKAYAAWLSIVVGGTVRLPTEAEWEYAARGKEERQYPWGDSPVPSCDVAVLDPSSSMDSTKWGCGQSSTWPVCSKKQGNTLSGLCDMAGNVWEWVEDCYEDNYKDARVDGSARTVCSGSVRVLRGGSWYYGATYLRGADRYWDWPSNRFGYVGFRVVWPVSPGAASGL